MSLKPNILDRYIMKKFILSFFISLVLIIGIVIIFDISEKIDDFVQYKAPLKEIVFSYYLNYIPYFMNMFSPLFVFITVIFFTSRLAANSEIIAMLSNGISYKRMLVPYLVSAGLICILSLCLGNFVIPRSNARMHKFASEYIKHHNNYKTSDIHYQIAPGQFVYVEHFYDWDNPPRVMGLTLESVENGRLVSKMTAESARWDSTFEGWRLRNYMIRDFNPGLGDRVRCGDQMDTVIALTIEDFYRNEKTVETLPYNALNDLIDTQKMRGDSGVMYALIEKNTRFAMPFSAFILTLIGVSLTSRKKRGGIGWNLALGIALAFLYILFLRFSQMFVYTGTLPPFVALWLPNVIYTGIAAVLYRMAPK